VLQERIIQSRSVGGLSVSADGGVLVSAGPGGVIQVWKADTREPRFESESLLETAPEAVAFTPEGDRLVASAGDGAVRIWNATTGEPLQVFLVTDARPEVRNVAVSPDGRCVAWASYEGGGVIDLESGDVIRLAETPRSSTFGLAFSPDGRRVAIGYGGAVTPDTPASVILIGVWDVATRERIVSFSGAPTSTANIKLHFSPNGQRLAWLDPGDGDVRVWDMEEGALRFKFEVGALSGGGWRFTADGRYLASIGSPLKPLAAGRSSGVASRGENAISFWDLESGERTRSVKPPGDAAYTLLLTPDGRRAVTSTLPRTRFLILDLETGRELGAIENDRFPVRAPAALSPDGSRLAVGLTDGTILIYALPPIP
jgi:WD40 repeat protein